MDKKQILAELGDIPESVYDELVSEAFEQGTRQLVEIERFCVEKDLGKAAAVAHSIKGCFANLRLQEISTAARGLEEALRRKAARKDIAALSAALAGLLAASGTGR